MRLNVTDGRIVQSPSKSYLPFPKTFEGLFTRWTQDKSKSLRKHFHFYHLNHYASRPLLDVLLSICSEQASAARPAHIPSIPSLKRTLHLLSDHTLFNYLSLLLIKRLSLPASLPLRHALYLPSSLRLSVPSVSVTVPSSSFIPRIIDLTSLCKDRAFAPRRLRLARLQAARWQRFSLP